MNQRDIFNNLLNLRDDLNDQRSFIDDQIQNIDGILDDMTGSTGSSNWNRGSYYEGGSSGRGSYRGHSYRGNISRGRMSGGYNRYDEGQDVDSIGDLRNFTRHFSNRLDRIEGLIQSFGPVSGEGPGGQRAFSSVRDSGPSQVIDGVRVPIDKSGTVDERTREGRDLTADAGLTEDQLAEMLESAPRNKDNTIDLRTNEGRALLAAGWVDDSGNELVEVETAGGGGGSESHVEEPPTRTSGGRVTRTKR